MVLPYPGFAGYGIRMSALLCLKMYESDQIIPSTCIIFWLMDVSGVVALDSHNLKTGS